MRREVVEVRVIDRVYTEPVLVGVDDWYVEP